MTLNTPETYTQKKRIQFEKELWFAVIPHELTTYNDTTLIH